MSINRKQISKKVCVYGAGAIGGFMAAKLAQNDQVQVSLIARGESFHKIRENGLKLIQNETQTISYPVVTDDPASLGVQDYVVLAVKTTQLAQAAKSVSSLIGPTTTIVTVSNGIPWWYFYKTNESDFKIRRLHNVDPEGVLWELLPPEKILSCVMYCACEKILPGIIQHKGNLKICLGEPDNTISERLLILSDILSDSGFDLNITQDIRKELWYKLLFNASLSSVSLLTESPIGKFIFEPQCRDLLKKLIEEIILVAEALGIVLEVNLEQLFCQFETYQHHKISMLQDFEKGISPEVSAIIYIIAEFGDRLGIDTPQLDMVSALLRVRLGKTGEDTRT